MQIKKWFHNICEKLLERGRCGERERKTAEHLLGKVVLGCNPLFFSEDVQMLECWNAGMFKCQNAQMLECSNT